MNPTLLLAIATLALCVGPLLEQIGRRFPLGAVLIDGATVGAIVAVAAVNLMPEAGAHIGWWALLLFLIGLALPSYTERAAGQSWQGWRVLVGLFVAVLFLGHLLVEGAALASTANDERLALATLFAVASHNLPVGAVLWGHTRRRFGAGWSVAVIALVVAATWFGPLVIPNEGFYSGACSALLAGGLVHLVIQHSTPLHVGLSDRRRNFWSGVGAIGAAAGIVLHLGLAPDAGAHQHGNAALPGRFLDLFLETAPPLLVGVLGAGLIDAFLPQGAVRYLARGSRLRQALSGVLVGAPMPVCSCGVLPIYRSLIKKGVPATAALALLVAAPEIGIDSALLSWNQLGGTATIARIVCALLVALAVGWVVGRIAEREPVHLGCEAAHDDEGRAATKASPLESIRRGLFETWGHLAPWILVGLYATILFEPWISTEWARELPGWVQILALGLLGLPTYICAAAATPFAAMLLIKGFTPGAVIAFLLMGPATNLTTFGALRRLHSRAVAYAFLAVALGATFVLGLAVDLALTRVDFASEIALHESEHGLANQICAAILVALTAWVILRSGPRSFVEQLKPEPDEAAHSHSHEHADDSREAAKPGPA